MSRNGASKFDVLRRLLKKPTTRLAALSLVLTLTLPSCATPFIWTDNPVLLYLPFAGRRSDPIPGYVTPTERIKLIVEKGKKGEKAPAEEKDVLLVQLVSEYEKTNSPHIRRAALEAIGRISKNYANPVAEKIFRSSLEDDDMNLNLSAARALGEYCSDGAIAADNKEQRKLAIELLDARYRSLAFSIAAGSEEENVRRKDVRIAILHALGEFKEEDSPLLLDALEFGLSGEKLDDGALEATACSSLEKVTGKKYGVNGEAWLQYIAYKRGEGSAPPDEQSILERTAKLDNITGVLK